jgi:hypothetical protein
VGVWEYLEDPGELLPLLTSPIGGETARFIEESLIALRGAKDPSVLHDIQIGLAKALVDVEKAYGDACRRERKDGGSGFEPRLWRRTMVQLRSLGDAIAWHFLGCRRQWILMLGINQHPGLMSDKTGFDDEFQAFERHWAAGEPTLWTGLTNCITATDLLVRQDDILSAFEVKHSPKGKRREQTTRLQDLIRRINEDPREDFEDGPTWFQESQVPLASFWTEAEPHVRRAVDEGSASWVPTPGVAVMFNSWPTMARIGQEAGERIVAREQAAASEQVGYSRHRVLFHSKDLPYLFARTAPMTIFPVSPSSAAAFATNQILFTIELYIDRLIDDLRAVGANPTNLLESAPPGKLPAGILRWTRPDTLKITLNRAGLQQLAYELNDPTTWVRAFESTPLPPQKARRWNSYVCLANEADVWS